VLPRKSFLDLYLKWLQKKWWEEDHVPGIKSVSTFRESSCEEVHPSEIMVGVRGPRICGPACTKPMWQVQDSTRRGRATPEEGRQSGPRLRGTPSEILTFFTGGLGKITACIIWGGAPFTPTVGRGPDWSSLVMSQKVQGDMPQSKARTRLEKKKCRVSERTLKSPDYLERGIGRGQPQ